MLALAGVQARVGKSQALDWLSADNVRVDDFFHIGFRYESIPDRLGINNDRWAVLALIEASREVGTDAALQSTFRDFLFKQLVQFTFVQRIAASAGISRRALVSANKNVFFEPRHQGIFSDFA
jgi:hypothetical protein